MLELGSHAGQLTRVLQEVLGSDTVLPGEKREWYMVEQSREFPRLSRFRSLPLLC